MIIPKYWAEEQMTKSFGGSREERVERFKTVYSKQHSERPDFDKSDPKDILNYAERLIEGVSEIQAAVKVTKAKLQIKPTCAIFHYLNQLMYLVVT